MGVRLRRRSLGRGGDYIDAVLATTPAAFWPMQESSGDIVDIVAARNGTPVGTGSLTYQANGPGIYKSINMPGGDRYFSVADNDLWSSDAFTVTGWVRPDPTYPAVANRICWRKSQTGAISEWWAGTSWTDWFGRITNTLDAGYRTVTAGFPIPTGWQFVVQRMDGAAGTLDLFINGVLIGSSSSGSGSRASNGAGVLGIGGNDTASDLDAWLGRMALVSFHDRALTDTEIGDLWNAMPGVALSSPVTGGFTADDVDNGYRYHAFDTSADLVLTGSKEIDYFMVGGGGGGGGWVTGGGGGGGGVRSGTTTLTAGTYPIVVGSGGSGGAAASGATGNGGNGGDTTFNSLTANGGGGGGGGSTNAPGAIGGSGGGGGGRNSAAGGTASGGGVTGNAGGAARPNNITATGAGGGGGGAGLAGNSGTTGNNGGRGGDGIAPSWWSGLLLGSGGGGGGGGAGLAGLPGDAGSTTIGGAGGASSGSGGNGGAAISNIGAGGGGAGNLSGTFAGGAGGSGIVIIRYAI